MKKALAGFLLAFFVMGCAQKPSNIILTVDMCQSKKPYEKRLFTALEKLSHKRGISIPVAVCLSGKWIKRHEKELKEIKNMDLDITWVNHSLTHPIENDFLNDPNIDFKKEVYGNIKLMESYGLKPSKYFRFPGLRHNRKRLKELNDMGFINLDCDAWLAKGDKIRDGSIVLVHGNGNEPKGIDILLDILRSNPNLVFSPLK